MPGAAWWSRERCNMWLEPQQRDTEQGEITSAGSEGWVFGKKKLFQPFIELGLSLVCKNLCCFPWLWHPLVTQSLWFKDSVTLCHFPARCPPSESCPVPPAPGAEQSLTAEKLTYKNNIKQAKTCSKFGNKSGESHTFPEPWLSFFFNYFCLI